MSLMVLSARPDLATNHRLAEEAGAIGVDFRLIDATRVAAHSGATSHLWHQGSDLLAPPPDAVLARVGNWRPASVLGALEVAVAAGVKTVNPPSAIRLGRDHWATVERLSRASLPVPESLVGADPETLADQAVQQLGLPVVVKSRRSRMGVGVILCTGRDHLEAVLDSLWRVGEELLVQRFLPSDGQSLRLLVASGQVVTAARFSAVGGEWRSNSARGGEAAIHQPTAEQGELAVAAARVAGLGLAGIDLIVSDGRCFVCEVNPTPGFRTLEAVTGTNVAAAVVAAAINGADSSST